MRMVERYERDGPEHHVPGGFAGVVIPDIRRSGTRFRAILLYSGEGPPKGRASRRYQALRHIRISRTDQRFNTFNSVSCGGLQLRNQKT